MSSLTIVIIAAVFVLTTGRREGGAATGRLSRETRKRDRSSEAVEAMTGGEALSGRAVERAARLERQGSTTVVVAPSEAPKAPVRYLEEDELGVTRRQFLNRGIGTLFGLGLSGFGAAVLAFLWPSLSGGFGSKINAGKLTDILASIADSGEPVYVPEGRFYLQPYPKDAVPKAKQVGAYAAVIPGYEAGVVALYQKCVHLGCRVPWCSTSQWFECPCHGSQYNRVGEKKAGPAPRGLDRFPVSVQGGSVVVDTGLLIIGPPVGTNTTGQEAEGPNCR
jgi:cytochrome b6-f complex iron-sulfur subunit